MQTRYEMEIQVHVHVEHIVHLSVKYNYPKSVEDYVFVSIISASSEIH